MDILKYLFVVLPSIIFIIIGICIKYFKAYWLISGYNTMSAEKKKNVDVEKLGNMMGNFCFVLALYLFFIILSLFLELLYLTIIFIVLFISTIIFLLIKSQKYDKNAINENGTMKTSTKIVIGVVIGFLIIVFSGVGILIYQGNLPTTYDVLVDRLQINGLYGEIIIGKSIINVTINEELPEITLRTNGSAIGNNLKGYFDVTGYGNAKLFVNTKMQPFIFIKTQKQTIILNCVDRLKTEQLYEKIKQIT